MASRGKEVTPCRSASVYVLLTASHCGMTLPHDDLQGKPGSEGENGNIMLLLDAAQELHRSSSGDEGNDIEPSTAGTGLGEHCLICRACRIMLEVVLAWLYTAPHRAAALVGACNLMHGMAGDEDIRSRCKGSRLQ